VAGEEPPDRPDLYVVARLLEGLWRAHGPMVKTRLQVEANVNYDVFSRYLEWILSRGLVSIENAADGHDRITLTPKGHEKHIVAWFSGSMKSFTNGCRRARRAKAYAMDRQSCPMNSGGLLRGKRRRGEGEIVSEDSVWRS